MEIVTMNAGIVILICIVLLFYYFLQKGKKRLIRVPELRDYKVIYDSERSRIVFRHERKKITAKPDFICAHKNGTAVVEYKDSYRDVYPSDRVQVIASTLAVRSTYPNAKIGFVVTKKTFEKINLTGTDEELEARIQTHLRSVRMIKSNQIPSANPGVRKCRNCGYNDICDSVVYSW